MSSLLDIFSPRLTMLIQLALIFGFFYSNLILAQESSLLNVVFGQDKSSFQIFVNGTYYFYQFFLYIVLAVRQYTAFDMFFTLFLGQSWFSQNEKSSKIFVTSNTKTFSNRDGSLVKAGEEESNGFDVLGNFNSTKIQWNPSEVGFTTELRTYQEEPMIVFSQRFKVCNLTPGVAESSLPQQSSGYFIPNSRQFVSKIRTFYL